MDEVHARRATYGADVMCLITNPASASYCGGGYLMTSLSTGFRTSAFPVTVRSCLTGHTMTHEIGHNARHRVDVLAKRMLEWCTLSGGIPGVNGLQTRIP